MTFASQIINIQDFQKISNWTPQTLGQDQDWQKNNPGLLPSNDDVRGKKREEIKSITRRVFAEMQHEGGLSILQSSWEFLRDRTINGSDEEKAIAGLFRGIMQTSLNWHVLRTTNKTNLIAYLKEVGFKETIADISFAKKFVDRFWSFSGSPRPRQLVSEWGAILGAVGLIAGATMPSSSNSSVMCAGNITDVNNSTSLAQMQCQLSVVINSAINSAIGGSIGYLSGNLLGTLAVPFSNE